MHSSLENTEAKKKLLDIFFFNLFFIKVYLMYSIESTSAVLHSPSHTYIHSFSHIIFHNGLSLDIAPCATQ